MNETWKIITEFPDYEVSDQGQVRSWKKGSGSSGKYPKILRPHLNKDGCFYVKLCKNKIPTTKKIHRLILETFIDSCPKGFEACHNNGNRTDNRLINLRWDTPKNNQADRIKHGTSNRGTQHYNCKLTEQQVLKIRKDPRTQRLIAMDYKITQGAIAKIKTHTRWAWL